jgi:hypothetical protein
MLVFMAQSIAYLMVILVSLLITLTVYSYKKVVPVNALVIANLILLMAAYKPVINLVVMNTVSYDLLTVILYLFLFSLCTSLISFLINLVYQVVLHKLSLEQDALIRLLTIVAISMLLNEWYGSFLDLTLPYPDLIYK